MPTFRSPAPPPRRPKRHIRISDIDDDLDSDALDRNFGRNQAGDRVMDRDDDDFERIRPDEVSAEAHRLEADLRGRSYKLHSAGYFIGLFALVVFAFGIVTMVIQSAPIASAGLLSALPIVGAGLEPPVSPAQRVALGGVEGRYVNLKGNQPALVISGTAENLTSKPLGAVQIEAALTASGAEPLRSQSVYCGNNLTLQDAGRDDAARDRVFREARRAQELHPCAAGDRAVRDRVYRAARGCLPFPVANRPRRSCCGGARGVY